jgi:hypothetical protein
VIGLFHPVRMLPIILLEIVYKTIWLVLLGFPMWSAGTLEGRSEEMMFSFLFVVLPVIATLWGYVFRAYFQRDRGDGHGFAGT